MTTNFELIEAAKHLQIPNFNCVMRDQLKDVPSNDLMNLILNSADSSTSGIHWVILHKNKDKVIYYSSFGDPVYQEVLDYFKGYRILTSDTRIQEFNTTICGHLCILILFLIKQGHEFEDIILSLQDIQI